MAEDGGWERGAGFWAFKRRLKAQREARGGEAAPAGAGMGLCCSSRACFANGVFIGRAVAGEVPERPRSSGVQLLESAPTFACLEQPTQAAAQEVLSSGCMTPAKQSEPQCLWKDACELLLRYQSDAGAKGS